LTATRNTPAQISPALAATQAEWHAKQSAEFYAQSLNKFKAPQGRATARNRFVADAKLALPVMGLEKFLMHFEAWLRNAGYAQQFDEAKATVTTLAAELAIVPRAVPVAVELPAVPAGDGLAAVKKILADALAQIEALAAL
jgi:hypothetical protein